MDREFIYRFNAVINTHPSVVTLDDGTIARDSDDNIVSLDESKIAPEMARLKNEYENDYARKRKEEYDQLNQFELIGEDSINGTTKHKDAILAIKAKHPKE
tara:strand:+ start:521 stop:823 length:303 start_codon:yes stop_codon:yes gene_type:complete